MDIKTEDGTYVSLVDFHIPNTLEEYKVWKKNQINDAYLSTVKSGFKSSSSGTELIYGYSDLDQMKWLKLFTSVNSGIVQYPVPVFAMDNTMVLLSDVQLRQLLIDINVWEWANQTRLHEKWGLVDASGSIEDANLIAWSTTP